MAEVPGYDLSGFGDRVLARRRSLGFTQVQLAAKAGVDESAVRRWEEGILPRDTETLARLAVALDASLGWLLGEDPELQRIEAARFAFEVATDRISELLKELARDPENLFAEMAAIAPNVTRSRLLPEDPEEVEKPLVRSTTRAAKKSRPR